MKRVEYEANLYNEAGVDSVLVENIWDIPYLQSESVGPEVVSTMTRACLQVRKVFKNGPVGVQILAGANVHALAVALAAELDYIRAEGYVFSHVADEGLMNACAGPLLRYRKQIGAENIRIFTDIKKKHSSHAITNDVNIVETAKAAEFFLSDGIVVTGGATGQPADNTEVQNVSRAVKLPVIVGSGVTLQNVEQFKEANGFIIGSYFKRYRDWKNEIDSNILYDFVLSVKYQREWCHFVVNFVRLSFINSLLSQFNLEAKDNFCQL